MGSRPREVPNSLRAWFVFHFAVDIAFAVPLLLAPVWTLSRLGWAVVDSLATRLVGAALIGIGVESVLGLNSPIESFRTMLRLKILWSVSANFGIAWSIAEGAPPAAWLIQGIFLIFSAVWIYYAWRLRQQLTR